MQNVHKTMGEDGYKYLVISAVIKVSGESAEQSFRFISLLNLLFLYLLHFMDTSFDLHLILS